VPVVALGAVQLFPATNVELYTDPPKLSAAYAIGEALKSPK
jgi:hypothetical protein